MLHIDAELYNPKVNNVYLLDGNRINPVIGIANEDIIEGAGIEIERLSDGKIKISTSISAGSDGSADSYSLAEEFDFLSSMPTNKNVYSFVFESGIEVEGYILYSSFSRSNTYMERDINPSYSVSPAPITTTLPSPSVQYTLHDSSYESGVGITFNITSTAVNKSYMIQISSDSNFSNIIEDELTNNDSLFISLSGLTNGTYYYRVRVTDRITLEKSQLVVGYFNFTYGA